MAKANFNPYRRKIVVGGHTFIIAKSSSGYGKYYVLDENGKYLSKGASSVTGAEIDACGIARRLDEELA